MEFSFIPNASVSLAATATTGSIAVPGSTKMRRTIRINSLPGDDPAYLAFGDSNVEAALTDMRLNPGETAFFTLLETQTHVAAICASTETAALRITEGVVG
jgi:hypothetical protein